jgi:hypothetical protein
MDWEVHVNQKLSTLFLGSFSVSIGLIDRSKMQSG